MKAIQQLGIVVVAAGIGITAGLLWGRQAGSSAASPAGSGSESPQESAATRWLGKRPGAAPRADDSPLTTQLARDLSMSSGVTRWLYWMDAIEKASPSDYPRLAKLAEKDSHALKLLAARWTERAPKHLFDHLIATWRAGGSPSAGTLATALFQDWPRRDLDAVITALNSTNRSSVPRDWRMGIASRVIETDVERGLKIFSDWNILSYTPNMGPVKKWAAANPRHAAEVALTTSLGYTTHTLMEVIGKEWAKQNPTEALSYAMRKQGEYAKTLSSSALQEWATRDLNAAAEWLGAAEPASRERLGVSFVEAWAKKDPDSALAWCEENLTGSTLAKAVRSAFEGAASKNVASAADMVSRMAPSEARSEAAVAVAKKWASEGFSSGKPLPQTTVEWVKQLDTASIQRVLRETYWNWSQSDLKGFATVLTQLDSKAVPDQAYVRTGGQLARDNPAEALRWAATLPDDSARQQGTTGAFEEWRKFDNAAAAAWLRELPQDDQRRSSVLRHYLQTLMHEPNGADQIAALGPEDRGTARQMINQSGLSTERRNLLLNALK